MGPVRLWITTRLGVFHNELPLGRKLGQAMDPVLGAVLEAFHRVANPGRAERRFLGSPSQNLSLITARAETGSVLVLLIQPCIF